MPSVDDGSLKNEQDYPIVEAEPFSSVSSESKESPITLEKSGETSPQEGIGDAFSQDHKDRFQSKNK
jgi:hypothetical protein